MVTAIGDKGESIFNDDRTLLKQFQDWIIEFFKTIGDKFGIHDLTADETFDRFTKGVVGELLGGKELSNKSNEQLKNDVQYSAEQYKKNENNKINEYLFGNSPIDDVYLQKLKTISDEITKGTKVFKRFSQEEQRGLIKGGEIHIQSSIIVGREVDAGETQDERNDRQESDIEQFAKQKGIWIEDTAKLEDNYPRINAGKESIVYDNGETVIKSKNTLQYRDLQDALDSITLHNTLFPETAIKVLGFGKNADGDFQIILEQGYVKDSGTKATKEQIAQMVQEKGFERNKMRSDNDYINEQTLMNDLHDENVIIAEDGKLLVIDPILHLNTEVWGFRGTTREVNNEIEDTTPLFQLNQDNTAFETNDKTPSTKQNLQDKFKDAIVVQSESELPQAIQNEIKQKKAQGRVKGVYYNGQVYMVADNIKTLGEATGTYRHETLGHKGVIDYLGNKLDKFAVDLVNNTKGTQLKKLQELAKDYGLPTDLSKLTDKQKSDLGQEYIAFIAENKSKYPNRWRNVVDFIKQALRDFGIKLNVSDAEIEALIGKVEKRKENINKNKQDTKFSVQHFVLSTALMGMAFGVNGELSKAWDINRKKTIDKLKKEGKYTEEDEKQVNEVLKDITQEHETAVNEEMNNGVTLTDDEVMQMADELTETTEVDGEEMKVVSKDEDKAIVLDEANNKLKQITVLAQGKGVVSALTNDKINIANKLNQKQDLTAEEQDFYNNYKEDIEKLRYENQNAPIEPINAGQEQDNSKGISAEKQVDTGLGTGNKQDMVSDQKEVQQDSTEVKKEIEQVKQVIQELEANPNSPFAKLVNIDEQKVKLSELEKKQQKISLNNQKSENKVVNELLLEQPTSTTQSDTEAKKADIERRKQELEKKYEETKERHLRELEKAGVDLGKWGIAFNDIIHNIEEENNSGNYSKEVEALARKQYEEWWALNREKQEIESDADRLSFSDYNFSNKQSILDRLKKALSKVYQTNRQALDDGFVEWANVEREVASVGGNQYAAHGMGKTTIASAFSDLINLFEKGINPFRGQGALDVATLAGGISDGTTAGGAYMNGAFTLVANRNHNGRIENINQIGGIIVNEGIATPEVLSALKELFPNLVIESTLNSKSLVEQLNAKYDAELKALEQSTSTNQSESNPALRDVESTAKALDSGDIISKVTEKVKDIFYTGRGKKYEDLNKTKGDFIFFSKDKTKSEWYGGDKSNVSEAFIDDSEYIDLTSQEKKSEFVDKNFTDEDITNLYPNLKTIAFEDRNVRKTYEQKLKELIDKKREQLKENSFSGDNKEQKFLLTKAKQLGIKGIKLLDTFFGKEDISTISIDKSTIKTITPNTISEAYHKAKADGSNPELVKAVESLLSKEQPTSTTQTEIDNTQIQKWKDKFEKLKSNNDTKGIQEHYDKLNVALNGLIKGDENIAEMQKLKKEIESYAEIKNDTNLDTQNKNNNGNEQQQQQQSGTTGEQLDIFADTAENDYANSKLTGESEIEQEPNVKTIESKANSGGKVETNGVISEIDNLKEKALDIKRKPISDISTDEGRFQGRKKLNEAIVNNIAENYSDADQDPIHIWTDPKNNKTYVLSGHHRYYGAKKSGRTHIKVIDRTNDFTEEQAIKFAKEEANANRSMETPLERANTLRQKRLNGDSKEEISKFLEKEGKNAKYIDNLSRLNPNGKAIALLESTEDSADKVTQKEAERIADWIGEVRKNSSITNEHETELFDFLLDKDTSKRITTKADFISKVSSITNAFDFDDTKPLNIARYKYKTDGEKQYDKEVEEQKEKINELQKKIDDIKDRFSNPNNPQYINTENKDYDEIKKQADNVIAKANIELKAEQTKLQELYQNKGKYTNAGSNQGALFQADNQGKFQRISKERYDKLLNKLKKVFPKVKIFTDEKTLKEKLAKGKIDLVNFMFVGLNEVANVFKSEAHISLKDAKRLSIQKIDPNIIRATTGWHQLDNGTWAYETSDKESSVSESILEKIVRLSSPNINLKFNLDVLLKHENLYKFAPSLKDTKVQIYFSSNKNEFGYFNNKDGTIYLNSNSYELIQHTNGISGSNDRSEKGYIPEETDFRKNLLHEIQHIIQFKNGFPSGANFNQILERRIQEANKPKSELTENELAKINYESAKEYLNKEGEKQANDTAERTELNEQERIDTEINKKAKEYTENVLGRLKDKIKFLRTPQGIIYGAKFPDGSIYLNPQQINANTPIHEFAHVWEELFPTEFAKGIELLMSSEKGRKYIKQIRQNPAYTGKTMAHSNSHYSNALLLDITNQLLFHGAANIIHYDSDNDFIQNFDLVYANEINKADNIFFVDDSLKSGTAFNTIYQFIDNVYTKKEGKAFQFDGALFLINKAQRYTHKSVANKIKNPSLFSAFANLHLYNILRPNLKSSIKEQAEKYELLSKEANLDSIKLLFTERYNSMLGHVDIPITKDKAKRNRRRNLIIAIHNIIEYCTQNKKIDNNVDFYQFMEAMKKINSITYFKNYKIVKTDTILDNDIYKSYLKALTQLPFIQYKPLKDIVFNWIIELLKKHQDLCIENEITYEQLNTIKFLIRRACLLNCNYIISKEFLKFIIQLYDATKGIPKLYTTTVTEQKEKLEQFMLFYVAQVKQLLLNNEYLSLVVEENIKDIIDQANQNDYTKHLFRILKEENTQLISVYYNTLKKTEGWKNLYKQNDQSIDITTLKIEELLNTHVETHSVITAALNSYYKKIQENLRITNNYVLHDYLWLRYFLYFDRKKVLSLNEKTNYIFTKLFSMFSREDVNITNMGALFLVVNAQKHTNGNFLTTKENTFIAFNQTNNSQTLFNEDDIFKEENSFFTTFLSNKQQKTIVELNKGVHSSWIDAYKTPFETDTINLSDTIIPQQHDYNRMLFIRISKFTQNKYIPQALIVFCYNLIDGNQLNIDINKYLLLLRKPLSNFIAAHHENDEFRDWQIANIKQRTALLTGHGRDMLMNIAAIKPAIYQNVVLGLLHIQRLIIDIEEELKITGQTEYTKTQVYNTNNIASNNFQLNLNDLKQPISELAKDIFKNEHIENEVEIEDVEPTIAGNTIPIEANLIKLICFELLVNAKKNRWHFIDEKIEGYTKNKISIAITATPQEIVICITNTGPIHNIDNDIKTLNGDTEIKNKQNTSGIMLIKTFLKYFYQGSTVEYKPEKINNSNIFGNITATVTIKLPTTPPPPQ